MHEILIDQLLRVLFISLVIPLSLSFLGSLIVSFIYAVFQLQESMLPLIVRIFGVLVGFLVSGELIIEEWNQLFVTTFNLLYTN